ncbi:hypothetical protein FRC0263_00531 [Corynebacterium diphtheriae]|nr:hypothetical protein CIP107555_00268 [Corynebacterium diphtheriae]CAB0789561.1 hypothetical protein FRC0263_00531 [Corynebacterium diphtheriae]
MDSVNTAIEDPVPVLESIGSLLLTPVIATAE